MTSYQQGQRNCMSCGRTIPWDASVCPYCGRDYRPQFYQPYREEPMSSGMRILLYVLSFLIPLAGIIIGAIYYTKPDPEYRHVGWMCLILALASILLSVVLAALLYVMVLGFGGTMTTAPPSVILGVTV